VAKVEVEVKEARTKAKAVAEEEGTIKIYLIY
jgi:hypothetical protein